MVILPFLLLAAAEPSEQTIIAQAAKCGLRSDQLIWSTDEAGERRAAITPNGDLDSLPWSRFMCMVEWAQATGAKVGFVAEPPPDMGEVRR